MKKIFHKIAVFSLVAPIFALGAKVTTSAIQYLEEPRVISIIPVSALAVNLGFTEKTALLALASPNTAKTEKTPQNADLSPQMASPQAIKNLIVSKSRQYGVNPLLALKIAEIESGFVATAQNPNSSAGGTYQFISSTWSTYCLGEKFNAEDNIDCAMKLLSTGGIYHWTAATDTRQALLEAGFIHQE